MKKIDYEQLKPVLNRRIRLTRSVLESMANEPDPILFANLDKIQPWFELLRHRLFTKYLRNEHSVEHYSLIEAINSCKAKGDKRLATLLCKCDKNKIDLHVKKNKPMTEDSLVSELSKIFPINEEDGTNVDDFEIFNSNDPSSSLFFERLTPKGRAAYYYLGEKVCPEKKRFKDGLSRLIGEEYELPSDKSQDGIALRLVAEFYEASIVTVPPELWSVFRKILKSKGSHRIEPFQPHFPVGLRRWEGFDELIKYISERMKSEEIPQQTGAQFFKQLYALREDLLLVIANDFNYRNNLIFDRVPFLIGIVLELRHRCVYRPINARISQLLKRRDFDAIRKELVSDLLFFCVFACRFYDIKAALAPRPGKRGRAYEPPKEAIVPFILPVYELVKASGIRQPRTWAVKILNSLMGDELYSETLFADEPLETEDQVLDIQWARRQGFVLHGERQLRRDIQSLKTGRAKK